MCVCSERKRDRVKERHKVGQAKRQAERYIINRWYEITVSNME